MKDPARLLDGAASEAELRLLRAGVVEQPPPEALARAAQALGLPALDPTAPAAVSGTTASAIGAGKLAALLTFGLSLGVASWITTRPAPVAPPRPTAALAVATQPAPQPIAAEPLVEAPAPAATPVPARPRRQDNLAREIAILDAVRQRLVAGDARAALRGLSRYGREHPAGALKQEAFVLRIEALKSGGENDRARSLAEHFLRENPDSPHTQRVRSLIDAR